MEARLKKSGNLLIWPDSYPVVDASNFISSTSSFTATEPCFAFPKGTTTLNGATINSNINEGICIILEAGDTISATNLYVYGLTYIGGVN